MGLRGTIRRYVLRRKMRNGGKLDYHGLDIPMTHPGMNADVASAISGRIYEAPEIRGLAKIICPGDNILELGAGLGIISALAARATGPEGRVLSFEANPALIDATESFWKSHGIRNIELRNAVLVDSDPGTRRFHLAGSFAESSLLGTEGRNPQGEVEVRAELVSEVFETFRPDVLICDIEGAEAQLIPALPGSGLRAAVIEFHPDRLSAHEHHQIIDRLVALGLYPMAENMGGTVMVFTRGDA